MAHSDGVVVGRCLGCGASLCEGEYTRVDFSDGEAPPWALYCKNKCEPVAESKREGAAVGNCEVCDSTIYEGQVCTTIPVTGTRPGVWYRLYCKNCSPDGKSKTEEVRVTLSEIPMMVAKHYAALVPFVDRDLVYDLTRDYHAHLLSIATVGDLPEEPTESDDDRWISVHDMMPKQAQHVLIWYAERGDDDDAIIASWWPATNHSPESWYDDTGDYRIKELVTHWQPLPGKPKGLE